MFKSHEGTKIKYRLTFYNVPYNERNTVRLTYFGCKI